MNGLAKTDSDAFSTRQSRGTDVICWIRVLSPFEVQSLGLAQGIAIAHDISAWCILRKVKRVEEGKSFRGMAPCADQVISGSCK